MYNSLIDRDLVFLHDLQKAMNIINSNFQDSSSTGRWLFVGFPKTTNLFLTLDKFAKFIDSVYKLIYTMQYVQIRLNNIVIQCNVLYSPIRKKSNYTGYMPYEVRKMTKSSSGANQQALTSRLVNAGSTPLYKILLFY